MKSVPLLLTSGILLLMSNSAFAQWFGDIAGEFQGNDNLPRAQQAPDQFSDRSVTLALAGGYHVQTGDYTGVNLTGLLRASVFQEFTGMNNLELGLGASISHKFGLGPDVPTASLAVQYSRSEYRNEIRDSDNFSATFSVQKRLLPRLNMTVGVRLDEIDGDLDKPKPTLPNIPGTAFDQRSLSGFIASEWDLNEASWISGSFELRNGDVVSTGLPYALISAPTRALALDTVFGEHAVAYRIDARTRLYSLDYNRVWQEQGTWYLGVEYQDTHGSGNIDYKVTLLRTGYIYSF